MYISNLKFYKEININSRNTAVVKELCKIQLKVEFLAFGIFLPRNIFNYESVFKQINRNCVLVLAAHLHLVLLYFLKYLKAIKAE